MIQKDTFLKQSHQVIKSSHFMKGYEVAIDHISEDSDYALQNTSHVVQKCALMAPGAGLVLSATIPTIEAQFELHPISLVLPS